MASVAEETIWRTDSESAGGSGVVELDTKLDTTLLANEAAPVLFNIKHLTYEKTNHQAEILNKTRGNNQTKSKQTQKPANEKTNKQKHKQTEKNYTTK